jgi:hypothetical protein
MLVLPLLLAPIAAQQRPSMPPPGWPSLPQQQGPPPGQQNQNQQPMGNPLLPRQPQTDWQQGYDPQNPYRFDHPFTRPPQAPGQGFPEFPPNMQWGGYPAPGNLLQPPDLARNASPAPLLPEPPDWPSWVKINTRYELPYEADHAVLFRLAERVWYRTPDEDAFLPLYHFDKIRPLPRGSRIQVRQTGTFLLLLHEGSQISANGITDLELVQLDDQGLRVQVAAFTTLRLLCRQRPCELMLPDGSSLLAGPGKDDDGPVQLQLQRDEARAAIFNAGKRPVLLRTPFGDHQLDPGRRSQMLLVPPDPPIAQALSHPGVEVQEQDGALLCKGGPDGRLTWSGARIALPAGASLRIDPLQGRPFAPPASTAPKGK